MDRCALFIDAGYLLADGAMAVHGTRNRDSVTWDYAGLLQLLGGVARERTGLPLLRCYWYEATVDGRRTTEQEAIADIPGCKFRAARIRPGRREGIETYLQRDLATLARTGVVSDAILVGGDEDMAPVVAEVQDLGIRITVVHVAVDGNWSIARSLRQECDDLIEIGAAQLRPFVRLAASPDMTTTRIRRGADPPPNGRPHGPAAPLESSPPVPREGYYLPPALTAEPDNATETTVRHRPPEQPAPRRQREPAPVARAEARPADDRTTGEYRTFRPETGGFPRNTGNFPRDTGGFPREPHTAESAPERVPEPATGGQQSFRAPDLGTGGQQSFRAAELGTGEQPSFRGMAPPFRAEPAAQRAADTYTGPQRSFRPRASAPPEYPPPAHEHQPPRPEPSRNGGAHVGYPGDYPTGYPEPVGGHAAVPHSAPVPPPQHHPTGGQPSMARSDTRFDTGGMAAQPAMPQHGPFTNPTPTPSAAMADPAAGTSLAEAVRSAHREGNDFGEAVAKDAPLLWLEAVLARKPRMPSDLEARLLQGSALPIDFLLHDEVRHSLRRGFWEALERKNLR
ncbi:NYN domain-containing protein [Allonocardiopsis opalescens]|uniref:Uncharacterized LabA/DUF88 family protein n=1 Tax=Allonocardiopsis opalescens TaxID=1144618 RepID=A0A2T0Q3D1_9ACTN|nr:NYN domain-containing protein [Allonocardiopsis opalescens]PRX98178.1 uncharacterized LabA/DUF88 family protein [Allonocardiopsis opalescens]